MKNYFLVRKIDSLLMLSSIYYDNDSIVLFYRKRSCFWIRVYYNLGFRWKMEKNYSSNVGVDGSFVFTDSIEHISQLTKTIKLKLY